MTGQISDIYVFSNKFPAELRAEIESQMDNHSADLLSAAKDFGVNEAFFYIDEKKFFTDGENSAPLASLAVHHHDMNTNRARCEAFVAQVEIIINTDIEKGGEISPKQVFHPQSEAEKKPPNRGGGDGN